jgi:hypothetical protein
VYQEFVDTDHAGYQSYTTVFPHSGTPWNQNHGLQINISGITDAMIVGMCIYELK